MRGRECCRDCRDTRCLGDCGFVDAQRDIRLQIAIEPEPPAIGSSVNFPDVQVTIPVGIGVPLGGVDRVVVIDGAVAVVVGAITGLVRPGEGGADGIVAVCVVGEVTLWTAASRVGRVGITEANLSKLKTGRVKAVRFSTLDALCRELECQPGDLLEYEDQE